METETNNHQSVNHTDTTIGNSALKKIVRGKNTLVSGEKVQSNFIALAENILQSPTTQVYKKTEQQLTNLYKSVEGVFDYADIPEQLQTQRFINKTGAAIAPKQALHTVKDVFRVSAFVRGIDKAITDLKTHYARKLHIVYPACGPMAPLMLPLLMYYKQSGIVTADDLHVTFIDIQEGAVLALKEIMRVAGIEDFVKDVLYMDAVDFEPRPHEEIHMVVLEAMQHGLSREGQLAIALHYNKLLHPEGLFLPENLRVSAILANPNKIFKRQHSETGIPNRLPEYPDETIVLGDVLQVNRATMASMEPQVIDEHTRLIECATLPIPHFENDVDSRMMMFCCELDIYGGERISEFESGISHPLPDRNICVNFIPRDQQEDDVCVSSGDDISFYYQISAQPGFLALRKDKEDE